MNEVVTPIEMAERLGVRPRRIRRWLHEAWRRGDRRLHGHSHGRRWLLDPGLAWDLSREFAAEVRGDSIEEVQGPHAWLNWHAFSAGRPKRTSSRTRTTLVLPSWEEYALYTDAGIRGEVALGPYRFINTIALQRSRGRPPALSIVIRATDHLDEPNYVSTIEKEDIASYFGGDLADELASLTALALGCRMRSGGVIRRGYGPGDSPGSPTETQHHPPVLIEAQGAPMLPQSRNAVNLEEAKPLFDRYRDLGQDDAIAVARSASQFADALWLADADPRLSWIKLVGAVESAANGWDARQDESAVERLRRHRKRVFNAIKDCGEDVVERVATDLAGTFKAKAKFTDFLLEFDPGPPKERPEIGQFDWSQLEAATDWIYEHRSRDLHSGIAFPFPLCEPPSAGPDLPHESFPAIAAEGRGGRWMAEQLPLYLHVFVHIAGGAIRRWWQSLPTVR